jgi:Ca2+-binding RTX toxin-like protein
MIESLLPFAEPPIVDDADGASQGDTIYGNARNNIIRGQDKADTIIGLGGRDLQYGGGGYDFLDGTTDDASPDVLNCGLDRGQADSNGGDTVVDCDPFTPV